MRGQIPQRPTGFVPEAIFAQSVWDNQNSRANKPQNSSTVRVSKTTGGIFFHSKQQKKSQAFVFPRHILTGMADDYLICRTWDGTTQGNKDVYIAKWPEHRTSLQSATIFGSLHNYTYQDGPDANNTQRTNTNSVTNESETELITPPWLAFTEVFPMRVSSTGVMDPNGNEIKLLGGYAPRQWAAQGAPTTATK